MNSFLEINVYSRREKPTTNYYNIDNFFERE